MQFTRRFSDAVRAGEITRSYRAWKRPQARLGGRYNLIGGGTIRVIAIEQVRLGDVSDSDARASGFDGRRELMEFLERGDSAHVYRIDFEYLGPGRLPGPDRSTRDDAGLAELTTRLKRMDVRAGEAWTGAALGLIAAHPGTRAADLAPAMGWETARLKQRIRSLKALGLTVSLETGYRLSPLGRQLHQRLVSR
jgi:hypothetical protein